MALVILLGALTLSRRPEAPVGPPDAAAARAALATGERLRALLGGDVAEGVSLSWTEADALLASARRFAPGVAAGAAAGPSPDGGAALTMSLAAPALPAGIWANLRLDFTAGPDGLRISRARLGALPLPPGLVQRGLVAFADRAAGEGIASGALAGVTGLDGDARGVRIRLGFTTEARSALLDRLRARLDLSGGGAGTKPVWVQLYWLDRWGDEGKLPREGSLLPWLTAVVARAERESQRSPDMSDRDHVIAAFLALGLYCGEPALGPAIGVSLNDRMLGERNHCEGLTLGGRDDLKRHFTVSAALRAASAGEAVPGVGELKELIDSGEGGSGFSFDDIAANLAGARYAGAFIDAPKADWPALLARVRTEADILPDIADLPHGLGEAEFRARFGDLDSPAYGEVMTEIARRIDALPAHRPL